MQFIANAVDKNVQWLNWLRLCALFFWRNTLPLSLFSSFSLRNINVFIIFFFPSSFSWLSFTGSITWFVHSYFCVLRFSVCTFCPSVWRCSYYSAWVCRFFFVCLRLVSYSNTYIQIHKHISYVLKMYTFVSITKKKHENEKIGFFSDRRCFETVSTSMNAQMLFFFLRITIVFLLSSALGMWCLYT